MNSHEQVKDDYDVLKLMVEETGHTLFEEHAWVTAEFDNCVFISVLGKCQGFLPWSIQNNRG